MFSTCGLYVSLLNRLHLLHFISILHYNSFVTFLIHFVASILLISLLLSQATASEGLAQGSYVVARVGFGPATLRMQGTESATEPPHPTIFVYKSFVGSVICSLPIHVTKELPMLVWCLLSNLFDTTGHTLIAYDD